MAAASLNWREIDQLLAELDLEGTLIQEIHQPSHDTLVFELRSRRGAYRLLVSLSNPYARLHRLTRPLRNPERPPRFASFLRAHVRGGRITAVSQVAGQRIVRLAVSRGEEERILWIRLWPTAANVIVTDAGGRIQEAFYRRPKRGEVAGGTYDALASFADAQPDPRFTVRPLPGDGDFNARVEAYYGGEEETSEAESLRRGLLADLRNRENGILVQKERLERQQAAHADPQRLREIGDLIMANLHRIEAKAERLEAEDFHNGGAPIVIPLDPRLTGAGNAEVYYEKASAGRRGGERIAEELAALEHALAGIASRRAQVENEGSLDALRALRRQAPRRRHDSVLPGLHFRSRQHRIMVGRTAADNDQLLRTHVAGNDYWFHARDWPGAYVFVKTPRGKSVPLDVMLDAANLAVFYSRGRTAGTADVYYTQVKYLRRARGGKTGLVIPTREKNLFIRLDTERVERIRQSQLVE